MSAPATGPAGVRRIRPTRALLAWAVVDVAGVLLLALGAGHLIRGPGLFFNALPASALHAGLFALAGLALIVVAAVKLLAEVFRQMPQAPRDSQG